MASVHNAKLNQLYTTTVPHKKQTLLTDFYDWWETSQ